jgi:ParB family transcriptional regulator, chromosome partitioning protein
MAKESKWLAASQETSATLGDVLHSGYDVEIMLGDLYISPDNVRKSERTGIPQLAANIRRHGLLQRLQVTREIVAGKITGRIAVEAGGRRLLALQYLANNKAIAYDCLVSCRVVAKEEAVAVSLAENIGQEAMHPADEFAAFQQLIQRNATVEQVAAAYGQTVLQVKRRMKMAAVAPKLFKLYRDDKMTLDQLMVLAAVDDHQRQLAAWKQCGHWNNPAQLKRHLVEDEIKSDDLRVKLVGLDAYKARGGALREDMFADKGEFYLEDPELVWMMLGELLDDKATQVKSEGWGWVEVREAVDYSERHSYQSLPTRIRPPSSQEAKELAKLQAASDAAYTAWDAADSDAGNHDSLEATMDHAAAALDKAKDALGVQADEDKGYAGAIVHIEAGKIVVLRGLVRRDDMKRLKKEKPSTSEHALDPVGAMDRIPERLKQDLTSHSTAAMQVAMFDNQKVALAALASTMALKVFNLYSDTVLKVSVSLNRGDMEKSSPSFSTSRAALRLDAERQAWIERLPKDQGTWCAWFLEQAQEVVVSMLVYAAAVSVQGVNRLVANKGKEADLAVALGLNMADWWQATPASYLALVPKSKMIEAVTEAKDAATADKMRKMKKAEAVAFASECLEGTNWLPPVLRRA